MYWNENVHTVLHNQIEIVHVEVVFVWILHFLMSWFCLCQQPLFKKSPNMFWSILGKDMIGSGDIRRRSEDCIRELHDTSVTMLDLLLGTKKNSRISNMSSNMIIHTVDSVQFYVLYGSARTTCQNCKFFFATIGPWSNIPCRVNPLLSIHFGAFH